MTRVAVAVEQNWNRTPGGTGISTTRLLSALLASGQVEVVGLAGRHRRPPNLELPPELRTVTIPFPGRLLQQAWSRAERPTIDRWLHGIEVVHAPAYAFPATAKPVVVTIHDLAFRHRPDWFTPNGVRFLERFLARVRADHGPVIVPSEATAADCVQAGIERARIHVVPWGVVRSETPPDRLDMTGREVLYVGTLEPRKNLDGLARAMALRPDLELVVVGPDGWGAVTPPPGARSLGELGEDEVAAVMASARVLVYPSHLEGFGLPVLEAMTVGTPVVTTRDTAPAWVAGDGGLAVDTADSMELAEAIDAVVNDDALHARLAAAARARAAEFSWEAAAARTIAVYELAATTA